MSENLKLNTEDCSLPCRVESVGPHGRWARGEILWYADREIAEFFAALAVGIARWDWHLGKFGRSMRSVVRAEEANLVATLGRVDGRGKLLAFSEFPKAGNSVRLVFDADDFFGLSQEGKAEVATHEIGHALGIPHVKGPRDAVMFPRYTGAGNGKLCRADVAALRRVYSR